MKRVLIVEDDGDIIDAIKMKIKIANHSGYVVDYAKTSCEAIKMWTAARDKRKPYELIVLDIGLRDISGTALAQVFRCAGDEAELRFLTGCESEITQQWARVLGAGAIWCKPEAVLNIAERINEVLQ